MPEDEGNGSGGGESGGQDGEDGEGQSRLEQALAARRAKLDRLRERGIEPFALGFEPTRSLASLRSAFGDLPPSTETGERVAVAGRVMLLRRHGKLAFATIRDREADLQLFLTEDALRSEGFALVDDLDLGDIVGAEGEVVTTRRGELSVKADRLTLLTKALRPLPEKWHGLKDPDVQQRQRYLHLATDLEARRYVTARAATLAAIRRVLDGRGFVEVETPVLQGIAGGAMAKPFSTHHNVLDIDLYLRISLELYLKRLLVGGLERVYEIGRNFRNEGIDRSHNPEFTMLELYQAYGDYFDMIEMVETLARESALAVNGTTTVTFRERELDLGAPWKRITVLGSVSEAAGVEVALDQPLEDLRGLAARHDVRVDAAWGPGAIVKELYEKLVEPTLFEPTFVMDWPREVSPLARPHRSQPGLTEHVDPVIGGIEMGTAYSELTDPIEQRAKFDLQLEARRAGDEEAHPYDEDFVEALEHGMPPAGGLGLGIDRLLIVLTDAPSIRDLILFPHHRPEG
jgi:lysyl-tRNA synthetase class 2